MKFYKNRVILWFVGLKMCILIFKNYYVNGVNNVVNF